LDIVKLFYYSIELAYIDKTYMCLLFCIYSFVLHTLVHVLRQ